jgi:type IV pilus assembly protein PilY1
MTIRFPTLGKPAQFLRKLFGVGLAVCLAGMPFVPAQASVTVDQEPLVVQRPLPPNLVLMLDDSGSMASDYMPDWNYLADRSTDGLRDAQVNGTYYDPGVDYGPPPKADGSDYPDSGSDSSDPMGTAYVDGFHPGYGTRDVTQYYGSYRYYEHLQATVDATYDPVPGCNAGDTLVTSGTYAGQCAHAEATYTYYRPRHRRCNYGDTYDFRRRMCRHADITYTYYAPSNNLTCPSGGSYDSSQGKCVRSEDASAYLFAYSTGPVGGPYVRHYVGKSSADCAVAAALGADCDYSLAAQQNVANWFSYFRTRILMAKSGVMTSFSDIDPKFRIGFGSINNRNISGIEATGSGNWTDSYNGKYIAKVTPFGDGSAGTQKAYLWDWLVGISPNNSTPLRRSLQAVGEYYQSAQPWQTSASDTTELACRQSYTILTTDGFWNGSSPYVGNVDGTAGDDVTNPNGKTTNTYKVRAPYSDSDSNTLADVAMKYWKTDLRPNLSNEVPTNAPLDEAYWQHMVTFTLGLGFTPTGITPSNTSIDTIQNWANNPDAKDANGNALYPIANFSWPSPYSNSINNIADLAHAGINGHGGFYSAQNPQDFAQAISDALARAESRNGSGASLAANSTQLKTGTVTYQSVYTTETWTGDLRAFPLDPTNGDVAANPIWNAAQKMPVWTARQIYTYNPSTALAVPFKDISSLSSAEQSALGSDATEQQDVLDYLRGDPSNEQKNQKTGGYRNRTTSLGDIVSSQPVYIGSPNANEFYNQTFTGSGTFDTFASDNYNRTPEVYVASNDGMLHAFDAASGVETYAYLPAAVIKDGVSNLAQPDYGTTANPHQYFNDGELTAANVYYSGAWHTVLVGTTGRGTARAVYALDITDPSAIKFLWERSANDGNADGKSGYIGQMTGKPVIAQTADGDWSVIMGNGYNSPNGVAALLQFDISSGAMTVYKTADTSTSNGLAAPVVWIGDISNGLSTTAYAGDLDGNVWSFPLDYNGNKVPDGTLLFQAKDANGNPQPITGGMLAGKNPDTGNTWLFFGTGRYLTASDLQDLSTQTWYGIIVDSQTSSLVSNLLSQGRSSLVQRNIVAETPGDDSVTPAILPARAVTPTPTTPDMAGKSGWYMDLLTPVVSGNTTSYIQDGERMVTTNQFQGSLLLGTTRIPVATDPCNPSGRGWIMAINPFTGTNPTPNFFDVNGDGKVDSSDSITVGGKTYNSAGLGFVSTPNNPIFVGKNMYVNTDSNDLGIQKRATSGNSGNPIRVSWRELTTQ